MTRENTPLAASPPLARSAGGNSPPPAPGGRDAVPPGRGPAVGDLGRRGLAPAGPVGTGFVVGGAEEDRRRGRSDAFASRRHRRIYARPRRGAPQPPPATWPAYSSANAS